MLSKTDEMMYNFLNEAGSWSYRRYSNLTEEAKEEVNDKVITKLFRDVKSKAFKLDFSMFDETKGDITKASCYNTVTNALKFLDQISSDTKNKDLIKAKNSIQTALKNLIKYKNNFKSSYQAKNRMLEYLYATTGLAIVGGTSYLVSVSVELVKGNNGLYNCKIDETTKLEKNHNLNALEKFNSMCSSSQLNTAFSKLLKVRNEDILVTAGTTIAVIMLAIYTIREVVFGYYYVRVSLSAYLEQLSKFVLLNASRLDDKDVKTKQENIAKRLRMLSQKIAVDQDLATSRSEDDSKKSDKEAAETAKGNDSGSSDNSDIGDIF